MHWTKRRERFRAILAGERCVHPASVYDPISARIAEDLGFESGMLAGSVASLAVIGAPDLVTLSLSEFAELAYRINRAGNLPLMVDADHGYGNALGVKRCVEELETAGVAALTIEDTELPAPFGASEKPRLIPLAEGVGKMKAALAGRQDPSLAIFGRTSAAAVTSLEDCIARIRAYEAAGVDALFVLGIQTREALAQVSAAVKLPLMLGQAAPAIADPGFLVSQRVRLTLQGHQPFAAGVRAVHETLKALREGTPPAEIKTAASAQLMAQVTREADFKRWTKEFLGG